MAHLIYRISDTTPSRTASYISSIPITSAQIDGNFKVINDELSQKLNTNTPITGAKIAVTDNSTNENAVFPLWTTDSGDKTVSVTKNSFAFVPSSGTLSVNNLIADSLSINFHKVIKISGASVKLLNVDLSGTEGTNTGLKTINNTSLFGSGNIEFKTINGATLIGDDWITVLQPNFDLHRSSLNNYSLPSGTYTTIFDSGLPDKINSATPYLSGMWQVMVFSTLPRQYLSGGIGDEPQLIPGLAYATQIAISLDKLADRGSTSYSRTCYSGTGWTDWSPLGQQRVVTASNNAYHCNTNEHLYYSGTLGNNIYLPENIPVPGDKVTITTADSTIVINGNGANINSVPASYIVDEPSTVSLCYINSTVGWLITSIHNTYPALPSGIGGN